MLQSNADVSLPCCRRESERERKQKDGRKQICRIVEKNVVCEKRTVAGKSQAERRWDEEKNRKERVTTYAEDKRNQANRKERASVYSRTQLQKGRPKGTETMSRGEKTEVRWI